MRKWKRHIVAALVGLYPARWKREYGLQCENVQQFCNLVVIVSRARGPATKPDLAAVRYAAMVSRAGFSKWRSEVGVKPVSFDVEEGIRRSLAGVEATTGVSPSNSKRVASSPLETGLGAVWMRQKDMSVPRVATDLRCFSGAPRLEVEVVLSLQANSEYLVQLNVPPLV